MEMFNGPAEDAPVEASRCTIVHSLAVVCLLAALLLLCAMKGRGFAHIGCQ